MTFRHVRPLVLILAITGAFLSLTDVLVRDQALAFAAFALFAGSAVLGTLLLPPAGTQSDDPWTRIAWGKFFVALVYASIAVACIVAMVHTPDAARLMHAARAAL